MYHSDITVNMASFVILQLQAAAIQVIHCRNVAAAAKLDQASRPCLQTHVRSGTALETI